MTAHQMLLTVKLLAVMGFAGGAIASFVSEDPLTRRRAVHGIASPALVVVWLCGYALLHLMGLPLGECWVSVSLGLSVITNTVLAVAAARGWRAPPVMLLVATLITVIVMLMVAKPRWAQVLS